MKREEMLGKLLDFYYNVPVRDVWMWEERMSIYPSVLGRVSTVCVKHLWNSLALKERMSFKGLISSQY